MIGHHPTNHKPQAELRFLCLDQIWYAALGLCTYHAQKRKASSTASVGLRIQTKLHAEFDEVIEVVSLVVRAANVAGQAFVEAMAMVIESRHRRGFLV